MVNMTTPEAEAKAAPVYRAKRTNLSTEFEQVEGVLPDELPQNMMRGFDDPTLMNIVYHAFDGRETPVPRLMTQYLITQTFPYEDYIPAKWRGKRVWYTNPDQVERPKPGEMVCPLSVNAPEHVQSDIREMGYTPGICTKQGIGSLNEHMRKHRKFDRDYKEFRARKTQEEQAAAFIALANSLAQPERRGPGRPPKERDE